jgi:quinol monooxygenase YgiN
MLIVTGTVEVDENSIADILPIAAKMAKASRAEAECHGYAFSQDIENPRRFRVYEQWTDEDALAFHFETPHMAEFRSALATVKITAIDIKKFTAGPMSPVG